MAIRVAINGLGRIGRCVLRAIIEENRRDIEVVAVNGPAAPEAHAHLLKYDSVHGTFRGDITVEGEQLIDLFSKLISKRLAQMLETDVLV